MGRLSATRSFLAEDDALQMGGLALSTPRCSQNILFAFSGVIANIVWSRIASRSPCYIRIQGRHSAYPLDSFPPTLYKNGSLSAELLLGISPVCILGHEADFPHPPIRQLGRHHLYSIAPHPPDDLRSGKNGFSRPSK